MTLPLTHLNFKMKKRFISIAVALLAAICLFSCAKPRAGEDAPVQYSDLCLTFSTKAGDRALATEADAIEGNAFHDVLVILTDNNNVIKHTRYKTYIDGSTHLHKDVDTVQFQRVQIGTYKIFAYANTNYTSYFESGQTVQDIEKALTVGQTLPTDRELRTLAANSTPSTHAVNHPYGADIGLDISPIMPVSGLVLSGQSTIEVGVIHSEGDVYLTRPVCRINVFICNHADNPVTINKLWFSDFNPNRTFLLDHRSEGTPVFPTTDGGVNYSSLPSLNRGSGPDVLTVTKPDPLNPGSVISEAASNGVTVPADGVNHRIYSVALYENRRISSGFEYRLYGEATISGTTKAIEEKAAVSLKVSDFNSMAVNEVWPILIVNPLKSNAKVMLSNKLVSSDKSINVNAGSKEYVGKFIKGYTDDERYIFYLKKVADGYKIYKDSSCSNELTISGSSYTYAISAGARKSTNSLGYSNTANSSSDLIHLRAPNSTNWLYNNNGNFGVNGSDNAQHEWALYKCEKKAGSLLRMVDEETGAVTVVDRIFRNQELDIIMNVYHNQNENEFVFKVDNSTWGSNGPTMEHLFR